MKALLVHFRRRYAAYLACWLSDQHVSNELLLQRMMLCDRYMDHPQLALDFQATRLALQALQGTEWNLRLLQAAHGLGVATSE